MLIRLISTLAFLGASVGVVNSHRLLNDLRFIAPLDEPPLYLPDTKTVRLATLGFDAFFSDVIWFSTMNYFGKQFKNNGDYKWLDQRCQVVLELQPKAKERYDFCATLLSWSAKDVEASNEILAKAIRQFPDDWRFYYLRGFNYWYFQKDEQAGARELKTAASLPGAPEMLPRLTAKLLSSDPGAAVEFLSDSLKRTADPVARQALQERLQEAKLSFDLQLLNKLVQNFERDTGRLPMHLSELQEAGILKFIPKDPFGGEYLVDRKSKTVVSTSGKKGLELKLITPLSNINQ